MKNAPAVAATCLLAVALAGCAGMQSPLKTQPTAIAAGGTYYCWRDRLVDDGSNLVCNWESSVVDACDSHARVSLAKSNVSGTPQNSRHCDNGQWLVSVTSR
jgi:hypothetical protein